MTTRLQREYKKLFTEPCEFWTSEDGSLMSIVCLQSSLHKLKDHYVFQKEKYDPSRIRYRYAFKEWVGLDYFDGGFRKRGKVWRVDNPVTEFPVVEYELEIPR